jgi:hypothetical protein
MDNSNNHPHFLIPEGEIEYVEHKPTNRTNPIPRDYDRHGQELYEGLDKAYDFHSSHFSSLGENTIVFKVKLHESQGFNSKERRSFLEKNNLQINALFDNNTAIVSSSVSSFKNIQSMVSQYKTQKTNKEFQYIDEIRPFESSDKQSNDLQNYLIEEDFQEEYCDLQLLLLPHVGKEKYKEVIKNFKQKIEELNGQVENEPYFLSDGTPLIRTKISPSSINLISSDEAVFRIEKTNFFTFEPSKVEVVTLEKIELDETIDIEKLPTVVILDNGVDFSKHEILKTLLVEAFKVNGIGDTDCSHGTAVASRAIFGRDIDTQVKTGKLTPKARIIDATVFDGNPVSEIDLIARIKAAVDKFVDKANIFNISLNALKSIDSRFMSSFAYELDSLSHKYGIQFVISSGNHKLWQTCDNIHHVIEDDDALIASPAEAYLGLTVGSVNHENDPDSISKENEISPYSRIGLGFARNEKPDMVSYGGNISNKYQYKFGVPCFCHDGSYSTLSGTSFAAPVVAGELAYLASLLPDNDIMTAKLLLLHTANSLYEYESCQEEDLLYYKKLFGNGLSNLSRAIRSTDYSATFICRGELERLNKQRIKFYMPKLIADRSSRNHPAVVTVTCMTLPPLDRNKGAEYLGAYATASLHKVGNNGDLPSCNPPKIETGRKKWQPVHHFKKSFCSFNPGDWAVWLQLYTRWEADNDTRIPYALAITIEDPLKKNKVYQAIENEVPARYQTLDITTRIRV